jgi:putative transposase
MRKTPLVDEEIYHIYNRGVDKRNIFSDKLDLERFFKSMLEFNVIEPIGSIFELSKKLKSKKVGHRMSNSEPLVEFVFYCLNPNHYHFGIKQVAEKGIEKFMQRLGNGYTKYFNARYKRSGVLFQGKFKSVHVDENDYLLHLSAYVNLNNRLSGTAKEHLSKSSWEEYIGESNDNFCKGKNIVVEQFKDVNSYKKFALSSLEDIIERKEQKKEYEFES